MSKCRESGANFWQLPDVALDRILDGLEVSSVIHDLGCGVGELCGRLQKRGYMNVVGFDHNNNAVVHARRKFPRVEIRLQKIEDVLQLEAELKLMMLSIAFVDDQETALMKLRQSTRKLFVATALKNDSLIDSKWLRISVRENEILTHLDRAKWTITQQFRYSIQGEPDVMCILCV
jgi:SAM-dependent methyltransferase